MIVRFIHRDTINPGLQAAIAAERSDIAEHFQKNLLHDIGGVRRIVQQPANQAIHRLLIALDQYFVGFFDPLTERRDQRILLRYGEDARVKM